MPAKFGREISLLMLPVMAFAGAAWWKSRVSHIPGTTSFIGFRAKPNTGPPYILVPTWTRLTVPPREIANGFGFMVETQPVVVLRGNLPDDIKSVRYYVQPGNDFELRYRIGKTWHILKNTQKQVFISAVIMSGVGGRYESGDWIRLKAKLQWVPRAAQEIRMKGRCMSYVLYPQGFPSSFKIPAAIKFTKYGGWSEKVLSAPFEIAIKSPAEPFPAPIASHKQPYSVTDATFYRDGPDVKLQLHLKRAPWAVAADPTARPQIWDGSLCDGDGKEVHTFSSGTDQGNVGAHPWTPTPHDGWGIKLGKNEEVLTRDTFGSLPVGGWKNVKLPLRLEAKICDGDSWPTYFKGTFREVPMPKPQVWYPGTPWPGSTPNR